MFNLLKRKKSNMKNENISFIIVMTIVVSFIAVGYSVLNQQLMIGGVGSSKKLYDVVKRDYYQNNYAQKYTGVHQDSFSGTGNKDIYYYHGSINNSILVQNNVVFAGYCWQMFRTTDTGGVKMIYNGEAENNQCLDTRGTHVGFPAASNELLLGDNSYYYGTDYTYDATNNVFTLSGTLTQLLWNSTNAPNIIGKFTCKSTISTGTCSNLYYVFRYNDNTYATTYSLKKTSQYYELGTVAYNIGSDSPAYVGYMYNDIYPVRFRNYQFNIINPGSRDISSFNSGYYSNTVDYGNLHSGMYTLINSQSLSSVSNSNDLIGKYVLFTGNNYASSVMYVVAISNNKVYYKELVNGDLTTSLTIGDSYTYSGGRYTLSGNVTNVSFVTWYNTSNLSIYKGKYLCEGNNTSCASVKHIYAGSGSSTPTKGYFHYVDDNSTYSFSETVSYNNGIYTLSGDIKRFWDWFDSTNSSYLNTHHYTCLENGNSCSSVGFVNYLSTTLYYVVLSGVPDINTALNKMLYDSAVNTNDSVLKQFIDMWYKKYLTNYDDYIEDTIFCNNRTVLSLGAWQDNGTINNNIQFKGSTSPYNLGCDRVTDQFSISNPSAKLKYKIGLISKSESFSVSQSIGLYYSTMTPNSFNHSYSKICAVSQSNNIDISTTSHHSLRPVISLVPDIEYISGNGSMENPYIIDAPSLVPESFATDSWKTIIRAVKNNNTGAYHVGDTRTIDMGDLGIHTLRIANKSTPSQCSGSVFSKTACGFVLEFADVINTHGMHTKSSNVGGWPACEMRTYVNTTIYNSLPEILRNNIIDTTVISGHGSTSGETNFTSTDKIYLLCHVEVHGSNSNTDTVTLNETRQLDYYSAYPVNMTEYSGAIKQLNGTNQSWWLRTPYATSNTYYRYVYTNGVGTYYTIANYALGLSPAFRIG